MTRDQIISADRGNGGMFAVIPGVVLKDPALSKSAVLLYGIITWKCNENSCCWASNRTLGEELNLSPKRVSALISDLEAQGHIETEIEKDPETGQVKNRRIYPIVKSSRKRTDPIPKNEDTPPQIRGEVSPNSGGGIPKNEEEKDKYKHKEKLKEEPPKAPQGGRGRTLPNYQPEWFERFWALYPRKTNRVAAVRAWDKLKPDWALCGVMAKALLEQIKMPQWEDGQHIPHPSTWLNGARWMDEIPKAREPARHEEVPVCGWR